MDIERENFVQEFIELWTKGFAEAGVSPQKIYSHIAPFPRCAFKLGGNQGPPIHNTITSRLRQWPSGNTTGPVSQPIRRQAGSTTFTKSSRSTSRSAGHRARERIYSSE